MSSGGGKYTHDELVAMLERSIVLKARKDERAYSEEDVVAAASELDLDPALVREAAAEVEARRAARALAPRPFDTRIELRVAEGRLALRVPPLRPSPRTLAPLGFTAFWFAFMAFWTTNAARGSGMFAAFSVPFWIVGLGMLGRFALPLFQTTTVELGPDEGRLATTPLGRRRALRVAELRARLGKHKRWQHRGTEVKDAEEPALLLEHGTTTLPLLLGYSEAEQRWVEGELRAFLEAAGK